MENETISYLNAQCLNTQQDLASLCPIKMWHSGIWHLGVYDTPIIYLTNEPNLQVLLGIQPLSIQADNEMNLLILTLNPNLEVICII